jgi:mono/diheme cytochrome c family protein
MRVLGAAIAPAWFAAFAVAAPDVPSKPMVLGTMVAARAEAPSTIATANARSLYVLHCAGCHGADGAGTSAGGVPDVRRLGDWLRVPGGREFIISVPGVMGSGLDDAQVAAVTNWMLATIAPVSLPPAHAPFTAAEVALARAKPLIDVATTRGRLVQEARAIGIALP